MVHIRLLNWKMSDIEDTFEKGIKPVEDMTALEKLQVILNQELSLATSSVYQKGFASAYFETEIHDRIKDIIPYIGAGVTAKRCRNMATQAINICESLADLIGEASKCNKFDDSIIKWVKLSIKDIGLFEPSTKEDEEDESNTDGTIPFGQSDLYVILPDDKYDELMEKIKDNPNSESDGPKMHIKREHPKEEKQEENSSKPQTPNESDGNSECQTSEGKPEDYTGEKPDSEPNADTDGKENSDSGETGEKTGSSISKNKTSKDQSDTDNGETHSDETSAGNQADDSRETGGHQNSTQGKNQKGDSSGADKSSANADKSEMSVEDIEKQIEEDMKAAADAARGMAKDTSDNLDTILQKQEKSQSMSTDTTEPVKPTDEAIVAGINANYEFDMQLIELERKYEVDTMLPPDFKQEIETLAKKLENFMHEKKKRWRKQINSGKLDSSRTAMLAANEINVFKEKKISKGIKACAEIMVDNSGSMGYGADSKREYACKALALIEMVFAKFFPIKIFAFDANGSAVIHEIIKGWNEKFSRSGAYNFLEKGRYGSSNFDGFSIRVATADLLKRPEKKKLLVILSDGAPCYGGADDVKKAVQEARSKGITVVSIYFSEYLQEENTDFFKDMYEKDYIICEPDEIGENLTRVLKKFFL